MSRSRVCRAAAPFTRPSALQAPFEIEASQRNDWFRFQNAASNEGDTTHLYIYDVIGGWFGVYASDFMYELKNVKTGNIKLHLNSPGGDVFDAVAIYNALRDHDATVDVDVEALAASAASFIMQAGDTVTMKQGSMAMIHDALAMTYGNEEEHNKTASLLSKVSDNIAEIYAGRAGGSGAEWRETMRAEAWYTAKEAVEAGLADVVDEGSKADDKAKNKFDLSVFNYAGRDKAPSPFAIMNRAKEKAVPKNENENEPVTEPNTEPVKEPEQPNTPGAPGTPEQPVTPEGDPVEAPEAEPGVPDGTKADDKNVTVFNTAGGIILNGVCVTDPQKIQDHINSLEGFRRETGEANRKEFVEQLAHDNKIPASRIENLTAYALSLSSDEAFAAWSATYEDMPSNPAFAGEHGDPSKPGGDPTAPTALDKQLETARAIVEQHKKSGMKQERLEKTPSYQLLQSNNAL